MCEKCEDSDRFISPTDLEVERRGFFMGVGYPTADGNGFDHHYGMWRDKDTIVKLAPDFIAHAFPLLAVAAPDFVNEMLESIKALDMDTEENHLYSAEVGFDMFFVSNHIPKSLPDSSSTFNMLGDHSKCTEDYCTMNDEPADNTGFAMDTPDDTRYYEKVLDEDERTGN